MMKPKILVVADDAQLRATLARWLLRVGYAVELAESPRRADEVAASGDIALSIVAPHGLGAAGVELTQKLAGERGRVIVVAEPTDGAAATPPLPSDASLSMPLNETEVLAKVKSALSAPAIPRARAGRQLISFEGYTLDADGRVCTDANGQELTLTRAEFSLLLAFARQPGRVLSRDELTQVVAGRGAEPDDRSVDVLISRLRRKIEPDPKTPRFIVTVPGEGYKLTAKTQVAVAADPVAALPSSDPSAQSAAAQHAGPAGTGAQAAPARTRRALPVALAAVLVVAVLGWGAWSNRAALQPAAEVAPSANAPGARPPATPAQPGASEEERRAAVFKRMVASMQDNRFDWRTVERLAIESGVNETEAHEILAEHPAEVVLGKSRDGKLIARLSER
jgi:DNA-binding response OmpR family regulator